MTSVVPVRSTYDDAGADGREKHHGRRQQRHFKDRQHGETGQSGKTPGTDLREGKRTLPVLHVLASDDPADAHLQGLLTGDLGDDARLDEALRLLRAHPAMARARAHTDAVARQAQDVLASLPDGDAKDALHALATGVVTRVG